MMFLFGLVFGLLGGFLIGVYMKTPTGTTFTASLKQVFTKL